MDTPADDSPPPSETVARQLAAARQQLAEAEAYGIDIGALRVSLRMTPTERLRANDDALAFFRAASLHRRSLR